MMLQLQRYDMSLVYKKGCQLLTGNTLSRAQLNETSPADIYEDYEILTVQPVGLNNTDERETALDPTMVNLASVSLHGWPVRENDQLATRDGVIYKGENIVVPKSLRSDYLFIMCLFGSCR